MTKIALLWFKCSRCAKDFLSYVEGQWIWCDNHEHNGDCFQSEELGAIHGNSFLNTIKGKRECKRCSKHVDLMTYNT